MFENHGWKFALIIFILAGFATALSLVGLNLGLDLRGGAELIYKLPAERIKDQETPKAEITDSVIQVLQTRVDSLGLRELSIRRAGVTGINVQLPGYSRTEIERMKKLIGRAGKLDFKMVAQEQDPDLIADIQAQKEAGTYDEDVEAYDVCVDERTGRPLLLDNSPDMKVEGRHLVRAYPTRAQDGTPAVGFTFDADGAEQFGEITTNHTGRRFAIVLDGMAKSVPNIDEPILGGSGIIRGQFKQQEVRDLVIVLKSGTLKVKPRLEYENTVGAKLGEAAVQTGLIAIGAGLIFVLIFMVIYYRVSGGVANVALLMNLVLLLGVMALFEATLTLPGIAGILLTVGMAVDANILIFERIREEKAKGASLKISVEQGYARAFWTIFDANITTLLTALVLYYVGTGPIKGFAVTLSVGILASMFTALFVTRAILGILIGKGVISDLNMMSVLENPTFEFIGKRTKFIVGSLIVLNVGFLLFTVRGQEKYGIDFTGGSLVQMRLAEPMAKKDLENTLRSFERLDPATDKKIRPYRYAEVQRVGEEIDGKGVAYQIRARGVVDQEAIRADLEAAVSEGNKERFLTLLTNLGFSDQRATDYWAHIGEIRDWNLDRIFEQSVNVLQRDLQSLFGGSLAPEAYQDIGSGDSYYKIHKTRVAFTTEKSEQGNEAGNGGNETGGTDDGGTGENGSDDSGEGAGGGSAGGQGDPADDGGTEADDTPTEEGDDAGDQPAEDEGEEASPDEGDDEAEEGDDASPADDEGEGDEETEEGPAPDEPLPEGKGYVEVVVNLIPSAEHEEEPSADEIKEGLAGAGYPGCHVEVLPITDKHIQPIRVVTGPVSIVPGQPERHASAIQQYFATARADDGTYRYEVSHPFPQQSEISESVAYDLIVKAFLAIFFSLIVIVIYITFRFEFRFGIAAITCLFHDVLITMGFLALLDFTSVWTGLDVKINLPTIAAFLTIIGYSLNDTIVVFDRIRENMEATRRERPKDDQSFFENLVNESINQTLSRTIWTSLTTVLAIGILVVAGVPSIQGFAIAICFGVLIGTYSSIYVASPALVTEQKKVYTTLATQFCALIVISILWNVIMG